MDLILTGRSVSGEEARQMGLANRITKKGDALTGAIELASQLCQFPQGCMRSDRQSAYEQWDMDIPTALRREIELGLNIIRSGETREGATRFAQGKGRHGNFENL
jgi:enoyl-CoA hydratase